MQQRIDATEPDRDDVSPEAAAVLAARAALPPPTPEVAARALDVLREYVPDVVTTPWARQAVLALGSPLRTVVSAGLEPDSLDLVSMLAWLPGELPEDRAHRILACPVATVIEMALVAVHETELAEAGEADEAELLERYAAALLSVGEALHGDGEAGTGAVGDDGDLAW